MLLCGTKVERGIKNKMDAEKPQVIEVRTMDEARRLKEGDLVNFASKYCPKRGVFLRMGHGSGKGFGDPKEFPIILAFEGGRFDYLHVYPSKAGNFPRSEHYLLFGTDCPEASNWGHGQDTPEIRQYGKLAKLMER